MWEANSFCLDIFLAAAALLEEENTQLDRKD